MARNQFRLSVPRTDPLWQKLFNLFKDSLKSQGLATFAEIDRNQVSGGLEVPYWSWNDQVEAVTQLVSERVKQDDETYAKDKSASLGLGLVWGLIKNRLVGTRCVFSNTHVEIAPEILPVDKIPTYARAERRIFMSATISDESVLVRELGCSADAAGNPIELPNAGGIGERMVLVPRLMAESRASALTWPDLAALCKKLSSKYAVVVLTPSHDAAKPWGTVGATVVDRSADVPEAVRKLRVGKLRFVAFANRYDGLDLPDEACRVLVLDGAPMAQSLIDGVDMICRGGTSTRSRTVMHRIEQGLGRAVRSPADFAVIILFGDDLVTMVSQVDSRAELTDQTRRQIEFGLDIAQQAKQSGKKNEIETLAMQCLQRDPGWKRAYQKLAAPRPSSPADSQQRKVRIAQAAAERRAWEKFTSNQGRDGASVLSEYINANRPPTSEEAFLLQRAAWYSRKEDPTQSAEWQKYAREHEPHLLMPSSGLQYQKRARTTPNAAAQFAEWLSKFEHASAAVAAIQHLRSHLVFSPDAPSELFERALRDLGEILGFESSRPDKEFHVGPDVLWMDGQIASPLEAKNNTSPDTPAISKDNAGQLAQSAAWASKFHSERTKIVPLIAHPRTAVSDAAFLPANTRVLTPEHLTGILDALASAVAGVQRLAGKPSVDSAAQRLGEHGLSLERIIAMHTAKPGG